MLERFAAPAAAVPAAVVATEAAAVATAVAARMSPPARPVVPEEEKRYYSGILDRFVVHPQHAVAGAQRELQRVQPHRVHRAVGGDRAGEREQPGGAGERVATPVRTRSASDDDHHRHRALDREGHRPGPDREPREHGPRDRPAVEDRLGESLRLDTGCLVALQPSVNYDIQFVGGIKSALFGGEGLFFATLRGPGRVWLQSLPFSRLADRILKFAPSAGGKSADEGSILRGATKLFQG